MTILTHKGYQGSIEYEDGHLVIQLLHIDDFVTTTCDDAKIAEGTFHLLVDEYLETCCRLAKEPDKPYKGSLNVRMPADLHRSLAKAATQARVSLNSWIVDACRAKLSTAVVAPLNENQTMLPSITAIEGQSHRTNLLPALMEIRTLEQQQLGQGEKHENLVH